MSRSHIIDPLRKPIATCDFPGRGPDPYPPSGYTHDLSSEIVLRTIFNTKPGPNTKTSTIMGETTNDEPATTE